LLLPGKPAKVFASEPSAPHNQKMIAKIILTVAVILLVLLLFRGQRSRQADDAIEADAGNRLALKIAAVVTLGVILAGSALWLLTSWRDATEIVTVRVINAQNNEVTLYQAHRNAIDDKSFRTIHGVRVILSDIERLEVSREERY